MLLAALGLCAPAHAAEQLQLVEQKIRAGLLYNFLKYTQWPEEFLGADAPIAVCFLGGDIFDGNLLPMAGRTVNEHAIEIRNIRGIVDIVGCAMLVVHGSEKPDWPDLQKELADQSVLTVSDFEGFALSGGMIEFTRIANRVGVKLNPDAMNAAHLRVDDRLLNLATTVRAPPPGR